MKSFANLDDGLSFYTPQKVCSISETIKLELKSEKKYILKVHNSSFTCILYSSQTDKPIESYEFSKFMNQFWKNTGAETKMRIFGLFCKNSSITRLARIKVPFLRIPAVVHTP